jgi:hypothetical protein
MNDRVLAVLVPVLVDLGAAEDPECWVVWGEDPDIRYPVLAPTIAGLISVQVRVGGPEEGARAAGKLVRWSKLQVSELSLEASAGHRMVAVQVEGMVLKGLEEEADRVCEFVRGLIAGMDGRLVQAVVALAPSAPAAAVRAATPAPAAAAVKAPAVPAVAPAPKAPAKAPVPALPAGKPVAARAEPPAPKTAGAKEPGPAPKAPAAKAGKSKKGAAPATPAPDKSDWVAPHPIGAKPATPASAPSAPHVPASAPSAPHVPPAVPHVPPAVPHVPPVAPAVQQPAPVQAVPPASAQPPVDPYAVDAGVWEIPELPVEQPERKRPRWTP